MSPSIVTMITLIATTMMTNTSNNHCNKSRNRQCRGDIRSWGSERKGDGKGVKDEKWETKLGAIESNGRKRCVATQKKTLNCKRIGTLLKRNICWWPSRKESGNMIIRLWFKFGSWKYLDFRLGFGSSHCAKA